MDENEYVCPLCCEELDISDRQFFPCKCGYQVCMWCWHRIRESESGLCPACRTPYGDDPHEFSAVDVEEVLKANKEKAAAEKREKERLRQQSINASSSDVGSDGEGAVGAYGRGPMDLPKDRTQLANMRVIRRNLVYAVGLPPTLASEESLRKPEYFGQYGKISKIVLNRNNATTGDPRRTSASAYVTFAHKEDTLACILALDGFYLDGRNVRASYGTSKYCSAFIKNVRCNNPDCTYLHSMGDAEDTFTKQEIQAGYVTSGRDVLARQQQIVAQALSVGSSNPGARRRVGGGGPSSTGKSCSSPVFPPPTYDEPPKHSSSLVPTASTMVRSASAGPFGSVASGASSHSLPIAAKPPRSVSISGTSPPSSSVGLVGLAGSAAKTNGFKTSVGGSRKGVIGGKSATTSTISGTVIAGTGGAPAGTTAASVVAGVHSLGNPAPDESTATLTTLTPLTPLKRTQSKPKNSQPGPIGVNNGSSFVESELDVAGSKLGVLQLKEGGGKQQRDMMMKMSALREGSQKAPGYLSHGVIGGTAPTSPSSSTSSANGLAARMSGDGGLGAIGGTIIGSARGNVTLGTSLGQTVPIGDSLGNFGNPNSGFGGLGFEGNVVASRAPEIGRGHASGIGGDIYSGDIRSGSAKPIGSGGDRWNGAGVVDRTFNRPSLWGSDQPPSATDGIGGAFGPTGRPLGVIGGGSAAMGGRNPRVGNANGEIDPSRAVGNTGSSTLASMLGINLPTGSGSLSESTSLWGFQSQNSGMLKKPSEAGPGVIGGPAAPPTAQGIGNLGRGSAALSDGPSMSMTGSAVVGSGGSSSDIALLQSLLPGVHITRGKLQPLSEASGGFSSRVAPNERDVSEMQNMAFGSLNQGSWSQPSLPNGRLEAIGRNNSKKQNQNIW